MATAGSESQWALPALNSELRRSFLHTANFCTEKPLHPASFHKKNTESVSFIVFTHCKVIHRPAITHRPCLHRKLYTTEAFPRRKLCTHDTADLYREILTRSNPLHRESFYTKQKLPFANSMLLPTQRSLYTKQAFTQKLLHRDAAPRVAFHCWLPPLYTGKKTECFMTRNPPQHKSHATFLQQSLPAAPLPLVTTSVYVSPHPEVTISQSRHFPKSPPKSHFSKSSLPPVKTFLSQRFPKSPLPSVTSSKIVYSTLMRTYCLAYCYCYCSRL